MQVCARLPPALPVVPVPLPATDSYKSQTQSLGSSPAKRLSSFKGLKHGLSLIGTPPSGASDDVDAELTAFSLLLHASITLRSSDLGRALHRHLLARPHLLRHPALASKLITMYSTCGRVSDACRLFHSALAAKSVLSSWVAMLIAYSRNGLLEEALRLFVEMRCCFVGTLGNFAFSATLKACSNLLELRSGRAVHAQIVKFGKEETDQVVDNALLRLYAECGCLDDARRMFDEMPERNIASWNTLLDGFLRQGCLAECLELFREMQAELIGFSWITLTVALSVCAKLTALGSGREIHAQLLKSKGSPDISVQNSLMDMYAKCGEVGYSERVFKKMNKRDLTSWNIIIMGYAVNGDANEALKMFYEMIKQGLKPDGVTFVSLLSSCSHAGFIAEGRKLFDRMEKEFGITPVAEHYACLVDLLGRAGYVEEALEVVETMPFNPTGSLWGSLLNSCRLYNKVELGEVVAKHLFSLEPRNAGNYVMLSNIYAKTGKWEDVKKVREMMESKGLSKDIGCSWIYIKEKVYTFVASGSAQFRASAEYKRVWKDLMEAIHASGHVPDTDVVLHDVDRETKEMWVCGHSERLAIMYGLIHSQEGLPIRITKNLRVCADCHAVMKIISRVSDRVIVLRDTNRFHHFRDGLCSCNDYW